MVLKLKPAIWKEHELQRDTLVYLVYYGKSSTYYILVYYGIAKIVECPRPPGNPLPAKPKT